MASFRIIQNAPGAADVTSVALKVPPGSSKCYFEFWWSDSVADISGPLYVQASNGGGTWANIETVANPPAGGGAGNTFSNIYELASKYVRVFFDRSAGDANALLNCIVNFS